MIVRTEPVIVPDPDIVRAMARLESQLRRAADDLAGTLDALQGLSDALPPLPPSPPVDTVRGGRPVCGRWMGIAKERCARGAGHREGDCRTRRAMDAETEAKARRRRR